VSFSIKQNPIADSVRRHFEISVQSKSLRWTNDWYSFGKTSSEM